MNHFQLPSNKLQQTSFFVVDYKCVCCFMQASCVDQVEGWISIVQLQSPRQFTVKKMTHAHHILYIEQNSGLQADTEGHELQVFLHSSAHVCERELSEAHRKRNLFVPCPTVTSSRYLSLVWNNQSLTWQPAVMAATPRYRNKCTTVRMWLVMMRGETLKGWFEQMKAKISPQTHK